VLGEQIAHERGQVTGLRVLAGEDGPKVEVSFTSSVTLLGVQGTNMGTYLTVTRPDGSLFGEGQGVVMTDDGEMAAWKGQGAGRFTGRSTAVSWRGAVYFQTASQRLARLNGIAVVFEYDTDEDGKTEAKSFEWK
jgi:hypothetical protein